MAFLLADSFQSSLEKLNGDEQKAAKLAAFELQINPAHPGLQFHRIDNIMDKKLLVSPRQPRHSTALPSGREQPDALLRRPSRYRCLPDRRDPRNLASLATTYQSNGSPLFARQTTACDEDVIPNAERIKAITDDSDLDEVVATERHLLYVACTRARDHLLITSGGTCSEFAADLLSSSCH